MAEKSSSGLQPPRNPLLDHRKKGFMLNPTQHCLNFYQTDLQRGNGKPTSDRIVVVTSPPYEVRPSSEDDWTWKQEDDTMYVTAEDPVRASEADNILLEGASEFCNACYSALGYLAGYLKESQEHENDEDKDWVDNSKMSVVHHWNMMALCRAAGGNCPLCKILWTRCFHDFDWAMSKAQMELFWTSEKASVWDDSNPGEARLTCALFADGDMPRSEATFLSVLRFQLWPSPEFDQFFEHSLTEDSKEPSTDSNGKSSTRDCRSLALEWLFACRRNENGAHDACNTVPDLTWRPTRLLDLSDVEEAGKVRLACPETAEIQGGKRCEYITLSHGWGTWDVESLIRLTKSSLDTWQSEGIDLDSLPKTFKDAIEIAGWFGVRWLWVDSMCILRDSAEDWEHEAAMISEVHKHALLNISADDSSDARGGCFTEREPLGFQPFKIRMQNTNKAWWATLDERSLFDWVEEAPITKRAWAYLERQTSRRVLHFTKHEVFWECCAAAPSFASEKHPAGSPFDRDFAGQGKISFPSASDTTLVTNTALRKTWNTICEQFSTKHVSFPEDKLLILAGLAKEIRSRCPSDTYLAGMWSSCLSRQLLWSVKLAERGEPGQADPLAAGYIAPSWSWLSTSLPICMERSFDSHSLIEVTDIDYHTSTADQLGRISQAALKVRALVRLITLITRPSPFEGKAYSIYATLGVEKPVDLFVDGQTESADQIGFRVANVEEFVEIEDRANIPDTRSYHCMLVAVTQHSEDSRRELQGLLLDPADEEGHFRRVGVISFEGNCAFRMRYRINDSLRPENESLEERWQQVSPSWGSKFSGNNTPSKVSPQGCGPLSLYEFDVGVDNTWLEQLEPSEITLV